MQSRLATVALTCFYLHASPTAIRTLRISDAARSVEARLPSLPTGIYMVLFVLNLFLATCILGVMAAVAPDVIGYVWCDGDVLVHGVSNYGDSLAHGEGSKNCSDSQAVDMTEDKTCHGSCRCKADHIKRNLNLGIFCRYNLRQLSWEKVCRDDWKSTSVGHFLRTVQYMPFGSSPYSCVCSRLISPSVSS